MKNRGGILNRAISGTQQLISIMANMTATEKNTYNELANPGSSAVRHILTGAFGVVEVGKANQEITIVGANLTTIITSSYTVSFYQTGTGIKNTELTATLTIDSASKARLFVTASASAIIGTFDIVITSVNVPNDRLAKVGVVASVTQLNFNSWEVFPATLSSVYAQGGNNTAFCGNQSSFVGTVKGAFEFAIKSLVQIPTTNQFYLSFTAENNVPFTSDIVNIGYSAYIGLADSSSVNKFIIDFLLGTDKERVSATTTLNNYFITPGGARQSVYKTETPFQQCTVIIQGSLTDLTMSIIHQDSSIATSNTYSRGSLPLKLKILVEQDTALDKRSNGTISNINCKIW